MYIIFIFTRLYRIVDMQLENSDIFNPIGTQESLEIIDTHTAGRI